MSALQEMTMTPMRFLHVALMLAMLSGVLATHRE